MSQDFQTHSIEQAADAIDELERLESELRQRWQVGRPRATQAWARRRAALPAATIANGAKRVSSRPILSATR